MQIIIPAVSYRLRRGKLNITAQNWIQVLYGYLDMNEWYLGFWSQAQKWPSVCWRPVKCRLYRRNCISSKQQDHRTCWFRMTSRVGVIQKSDVMLTSVWVWTDHWKPQCFAPVRTVVASCALSMYVVGFGLVFRMFKTLESNNMTFIFVMSTL